ncbi:hypothetical protein Vi05172_g9552 [Venturia inaequalis]|nr:hypothetical protein Vi05172_g9552 [Venturia inaequalis]
MTLEMSEHSGQGNSEPEELALRPDAYTSGSFLKVHQGDIFQERYIVLEKLGFGTYCTVWLVHDSYKNCYLAMKVLSTECYNRGHDLFELDILEYLQDCTLDHPGRPHVSKLVDSFSEQTDIGIVLFILFDVLAETLHGFMRKIKHSQIGPWRIMKRFVKQLLLALDYAHKSGVIHTDIKSDNIMVQLPNDRVVSEYLDDIPKSKPKPVGNAEPAFLHWPNSNAELLHREHGINRACMLTIEPWEHSSTGMAGYYLSGMSSEEDLLDLNVTLVDWGLATWTGRHLDHPISSQLMKSPESLLGVSWDSKTDIWSLGVLILEMLSGWKPFVGEHTQQQYRYLTEEEREFQDADLAEERQRRWDEHQEMPQADGAKQAFVENESGYDFGMHLKEIATVIEPFPASLLERVKDKQMQWQLKSIFSEDGTVWGHEEEPYGAPLFRLEDFFASVPDCDDKEDLLNLLWKMMRVDPDDRYSAEELLEEPWLLDVVLDEEVITPPTPLPASLDKHDHEETYCDFTDALHEIVDPLDCDTYSDTSSDCSHSTHSDTSAHTNSTTLNLDYLIDLVACEDISKTDSDDDTVADMEIEISTTCTNALTRVDSRISDPNDGFVVDMDVGTSDSCARTTTPILEPLDDIFADVNDFVADIGVETFITPTTLTPEPLYENAAQPDINIAPIIKKSAPVAESTKTSSPSQEKAKSNAAKKNKNKNKKNKKGKRAAKR